MPVTLCDGGSTRGQSVLNALRAAQGQPGDIAVIHDAARCFQSLDAVRAAIDSAKANGSGVASLPMTDSVFETDTQKPLDRSRLVRTQTPQAFRFEEILSAYEQAGGQNATWSMRSALTFSTVDWMMGVTGLGSFSSVTGTSYQWSPR